MLARHIIILHHVTMQLIKYTTVGYVNATVEEKGHDFTRIRGAGVIQTFEPMGKNQMSK